jgi:hypothetical protein
LIHLARLSVPENDEVMHGRGMEQQIYLQLVATQAAAHDSLYTKASLVKLLS